MIRLLLPLFAAFFIFTAQAAENPRLIAVEAIGEEGWDCKNSHGAQCVNFSRGNHRLRLEDVNVQESTDGYRGTFTVTNRRRFKADPHLFVQFEVAQGTVKSLEMKKDGGGDWQKTPLDLLNAPKKVKKFTNWVLKIGVDGDAQKPMASAVWQIIRNYQEYSLPEPRPAEAQTTETPEGTP